MRVLLAESDPATAQEIELPLRSEGFNVYVEDDELDAVDLASRYDYDIVLLGLQQSLGVLIQMRKAKVNTPVIVLSDRNTIEAMQAAFSSGADDYMTKPFHKDELIARTHAVVRRSKGHAQAIIHTGEIAVNLDGKTVEVNGHRVHLTGKEYQMLELLSLRKGTTLTKEMFLNHLYGGMDEPELKIIDVFICKLRKRLRDAGAADHIHTVWGVGYALRDDPATVIATSPGRPNSLNTRVLAALAAWSKPEPVSAITHTVRGPTHSVYAALKRLRDEGLVVSQAFRGDNGVVQRWSLTEAGRQNHNQRLAAAQAD